MTDRECDINEECPMDKTQLSEKELYEMLLQSMQEMNEILGIEP